MNENPCVLIVDDIPENIRILGTILRKQNYAVAIAQDGEQALEALETLKPDLILLDIMMPKIDGFEVCKRIKENEKTKDIPVIFISALSSHTDELKGLKMGAIDYIHKPFSIPLVKTRVTAHVELSRSKQELQENRKELALKNKALEETVQLREDVDRMTRHDLKTPLNAIIGFPQLLLLDDNLNTEQQEMLKNVIRAGNDMLTMINNSLDMFKMETGRYHYKPEVVDIAALLKTVVNDLNMLVSNNKVKIDIFIENEKDNGQKFLVNAEKILSYSLFSNLLLNAVEACNYQGAIIIHLSYKENMGVIEMTNQGSVPASIRDSFFDKYSTSGKSSGTGLGTYSAKLITEVQNGTIAMRSNAEQTTLTVCLLADKSDS